MSQTAKLGFRIVGISAAILALAIAAVVAVLEARAPEAKSPELFIQLGHVSAVESVAWSPDSRTLASGSADNTVKLWDAGSGQLLRTLSGHAGSVHSVAWSPDGKTLASGSRDDTVKLWDAASGQLLRSLSGHANSINSVAWSPDGKTLASGSSDHTVNLWDAGSGHLLRTLGGHASFVYSVAWSPDGKTLASGSVDETVKLWDAGSGQLLRTLGGHGGFVYSVAWSPDGKALASGSADNTVKLWEAGSGQLLRLLSGHADAVRSVVWSPDGKNLASSSADQTVKLWDMSSGQLLRNLNGHAGFVYSVAWSQDGKALASSSVDNTVKLWDVGSGQLLRTLSGHANWASSMAWSADGKTIASGSSDNTVKLWETGSGQLLRTLGGHADSVSSVAWSPDGKILASASRDNTVKLWEAGTGKLLNTLSGHANSVSSVAWSPDGETLASGSGDDTVKLWEARNGQLLRTLSGHADWVSSVGWSPDGKTLASGSRDNTVKLWESGNGQLLRTLSDHSDWVSSVAWSPSGKTLASGSRDNTVKLWEAGSGQLLRTLSGQASFVSSVAWSPDGKTLASGGADNTVKLWEASSGQLLRTLSGHASIVESVAWNPDGETLASGSLDASIRIWSLATGTANLSSYQLPGNEWISWKPGALSYQSSLQGDQYAAIRFGGLLRPVYPLTWYRDPLKTDRLPFEGSAPVIRPKPIRYTWDRFPQKGLWFGGSAFLYFSGLAVGLTLARRSDPTQIARQFFLQAGFKKADRQDVCTLALMSPDGKTAMEAIVLRSGEPFPHPLPKIPKTYLIYHGKAPVPEEIHRLKIEASLEYIPLPAAVLASALSEGTCERTLHELEDPFVARTDPYDELRPITDPTWFYGREDLLRRLPAVLQQGQHAGLFGLRKMGKTSLIYQLRQRLASVPVVSIDCQGLPPVADQLFTEIANGLSRELQAKGVTGARRNTNGDFRARVLQLQERWRTAGGQVPFIVILDEVDKLFTDRRQRNSQEILGEWVKFSRTLRALAQEKQALVLLVTAYRPDVNRQNLLFPEIGENPMFMSFQEHSLGALSRADTTQMVSQIGGWKDIRWPEEALERIFELTGGHPLITRFLASDACEQGDRKQVDLATLNQAEERIRKRFYKHRVGRYYGEFVWGMLQAGEKEALTRIAKGTSHTPKDLEEAGTHLEQFGLVTERDGVPVISAELLRDWVLENAV